ncbi:MAG: hypothetical protein KBS85_03255 [Lachnospiraceae bacterium]|nr:hypothetical protein [Candidatus Merdinaster equi]
MDLELLIIICVALALVFAVFIRGLIWEKRKHRELIQSLRESFGKEKNTDGGKIPARYWNLGRYLEKHKGDFCIDNITWNDLEMDRVFQKINYTHSSCGEEYLYYRLRCPDLREGEHKLIQSEEETIAFLSQDEEARIALEDAYCRIGYTGKFSLYQYLDFLDNLGERNNLKHFVPYLFYAAGTAACFFVPAVGFTILIVTMIYMLFASLKEKSANEPYLVSFSFITRLLRHASVLKEISHKSKGLSEIEELLRERLKATSKLLRHPFFTKNDSGGNPFEIIVEYIKMITHFDLVSFNNMLRDTRSHEAEIDEVYTVMGYLEYLLAISHIRAGIPGTCVPVHLDYGKGIDARNIHHPLVAGAVPCSVTENKPLLVTGSNASGKSTFLREMGICVLLSQALNTTFADEYRGEYFRIYSSMALTDDLEAGDSYYMAEIRALKRIINANKDDDKTRIFCLVDEVLRGTNTVERVAASTQVLKYFSDNNAMCVAATHDIELTYLLDNVFHNFHFDEEVSEGDISFSYKLKEGRATSRNAIKLLELMGYDKEIVDRAQSRAQRFLDSGDWQL